MAPFVIWDDDNDPNGNVQHCADHGVTKEDVQEVLAAPIGAGWSRSSGRPAFFGVTSTGRHLIAVYDHIDEDTIRPVTACDAPPRTRS